MVGDGTLGDKLSMSEDADNQPTFHFRAWRKFRGMTQEALASEVGVQPSSISQLETGKQGFTGETLIALARALECHPGELLLCDPTDKDSFWPLFTRANALKGRERIVLRAMMEANLKISGE